MGVFFCSDMKCGVRIAQPGMCLSCDPKGGSEYADAPVAPAEKAPEKPSSKPKGDADKK